MTSDLDLSGANAAPTQRSRQTATTSSPAPSHPASGYGTTTPLAASRPIPGIPTSNTAARLWSSTRPPAWMQSLRAGRRWTRNGYRTPGSCRGAIRARCAYGTGRAKSSYSGSRGIRVSRNHQHSRLRAEATPNSPINNIRRHGHRARRASLQEDDSYRWTRERQDDHPVARRRMS